MFTITLSLDETNLVLAGLKAHSDITMGLHQKILQVAQAQVVAATTPQGVSGSARGPKPKKTVSTRRPGRPKKNSTLSAVNSEPDAANAA